MRVWDKPRIGILARYDEQKHLSELPVPGSRLVDDDFRVRRFTYGINVTLPGGSLLSINHERYGVPTPLTNVDVVGLRWTGSF